MELLQVILSFRRRIIESKLSDVGELIYLSSFVSPTKLHDSSNFRGPFSFDNGVVNFLLFQHSKRIHKYRVFRPLFSQTVAQSCQTEMHPETKRTANRMKSINSVLQMIQFFLFFFYVSFLIPSISIHIPLRKARHGQSQNMINQEKVEWTENNTSSPFLSLSVRNVTR